LVGATTISACSPDAGGPPAWFEEVGTRAKLDFVHVSGHATEHYMPEIMGGGAAVFDANGDGALDLYLVQSGSLASGATRADHLYLGNGSFEFERRELAPLRGYGMGVACGDIDADGDNDLYVTAVGPNALLVGDGAAHFDERAEAAGVAHRGWGTSALFGDVDADGVLDLFVTNYLDWSIERELTCHGRLGTPDYCSPQSYSSPALDALYRGRGDGTFEDISLASGIASKPGTGLGVVCADFDGDGAQDLFVANDGLPDFLWRNQGDGTFEDVAQLAGCALDHSGVAKAGMGVAVADLDEDDDLDLLVCNLVEQADSLYVNDGRGHFRDRTLSAKLGAVTRPYTRFGVGFVDFDNDGALDLYEANGRVTRQAFLHSDDPFAEPNLLLRGERLTFVPVEPPGGTSTELVATSRAAAFGDFDDDGRVDIVVANRDAPPHLLRNVTPPREWIGFRLSDPSGASVLAAQLTCSVDGARASREVRAAYSYLASSDERLHLGLGSSRAVTDIVVTWPDGQRESFGQRSPGSYYELVRGSGSAR